MKLVLFSYLYVVALSAAPVVETGLDRVFHDQQVHLVYGKRVGLITNHTAVDHNLHSSIEVFRAHGVPPVALYAPEHGLRGTEYAGDAVAEGCLAGVPVHSLHGVTRRPTERMLLGIEVLVFDIQDVGTRSYTYASTLFYAMEEAAKCGIKVVVLDRPNPISGVTIDGPMLKEKYRSFVGYIDVPFCHGMTIGELALYFNGEYGIGCDLEVVKMKGWKREMSFADTGLPWVPTSPHIPHADSPLYYPMTNLIGEILSDTNVGVGYTLPFQVIGAPWIDGERLAVKLRAQNLPGVQFHPFYFRPFFGRCKKQTCSGVRIVVTDPAAYRPVTTQFIMLGLIKSLYPEQFREKLVSDPARHAFFCKVVGTDQVLKIIQGEKLIAWKLASLDEEARQAFVQRRAPYLLY
jgi:uncharacterized protein YbbC (DUF1343 family)